MSKLKVLRDREVTSEVAYSALLNNPLGRNEQLNMFLGLLNSIKENVVLTIDGEWGSGKTVFAKQLELVSNIDLSSVSIPHLSNGENFQENYTTYYFNAWENDYHEDPMQSLLFNLISDLWTRSERAGDKLVKTSKVLAASAIKTLTSGLIDLDGIENASSISDLAINVTTSAERKKAIDDILDNYIDLKGKKLLFIIDELDRCRPTFAVNLLEVIKHYFTNGKIVFLLSTNNQQLSHTIKKVYGESFDGTGYLNKFYDLVFNLPDFDPETYIRHLGGYSRHGYYSDEMPLEIATHLNMSLREINRYYSSLKLIESYLISERGFGNHHSEQLVKYLFIPFAYGLRIKNLNDYQSFVKGDGEAILKKFCEKAKMPISIVMRWNEGMDAKSGAIEEIIKIYLKITTDTKEDGDGYDLMESRESFNRVVLLMNSSGGIDEDDEIS